MRIIVTGGAGFIGSQLVQELARRHPGAWISIVDDFTSASFKNLPAFKGDFFATPCEELDWEQAFPDGADQLYHLASITDTTVADQRQMVERNVEGFRRVLRFARRHGVPVVYASSAATYGQADGLMQEDQAALPANVYGFSKMILDNIAREEAACSGLRLAGVRYFNVYGPGESHKGKMASMIYQLYCQMRAGKRPRVFVDGSQKRDFVYVKDAVAGTILAAGAAEPGAYNIGSGAATSFNEVIALLNRALGTSYEPEYFENPYGAFYQSYTQADLARSHAMLGYQPAWPPEQGIPDYVEWLDSAGGAG